MEITDQNLIDAGISFAATFSGVFLSLWFERRRSRKQEKEEFGRVLQGLVYESSNNHGILDNIKTQSRIGSSPGFTLSCQVLQVALANPLFHRWSSHSLVMVVTFVKTQLEFVNNILYMYREGAASGHGATERGINELKIRAKTCQDMISIMQGLLDEVRPTFGGTIRSDDLMDHVRNRFVAILRKEREELSKLGI